MAESLTVTILRNKQSEIQDTIELYEKKLAQARYDLAHVAAALTIFEASGDPLDLARYTNLRRLFRYREMYHICREALAKEGPLSTADLTERVMRAKGLDVSDKVLARAIGHRVICNLVMHQRRGNLVEAGREKLRRMRIWTLPDANAENRSLR